MVAAGLQDTLTLNITAEIWEIPAIVPIDMTAMRIPLSMEQQVCTTEIVYTAQYLFLTLSLSAPYLIGKTFFDPNSTSLTIIVKMMHYVKPFNPILLFYLTLKSCS